MQPFWTKEKHVAGHKAGKQTSNFAPADPQAARDLEKRRRLQLVYWKRWADLSALSITSSITSISLPRKSGWLWHRRVTWNGNFTLALTSKHLVTTRTCQDEIACFWIAAGYPRRAMASDTVGANKSPLPSRDKLNLQL